MKTPIVIFVRHTSIEELKCKEEMAIPRSSLHPHETLIFWGDSKKDFETVGN
jgi:hypothetical protein